MFTLNHHRMKTSFCLLGTILAFGAAFPIHAADAPKNIVLIAGKKSHGPEGNRIHDYPWSVKLLKVMFEHSNLKGQVQVEFHRDGWPKDERSLETADSIVVISDGRDGDKYSESPYLESEERVAFVARQIKRGCGFVTLHFSTFAPDKYAHHVLNWTGGYFDWETDGKREWYSAITTLETNVAIISPAHPICRGVRPFTMKEEFYYNIRFTPGDKRLTHLLSVPGLNGREPDGRVVAWAREREDGGRGFGTTCGHFYDNWKNDDFRKFILNAIAWTAQVEIPRDGVQARYYEHEQIEAELVQGRAQSLTCASTVVAVCLVGRLWAEDHVGNFPTNFMCMSNYLPPKVLSCLPERRANGSDWSAFTSINSTYEIVTPGVHEGSNNTVFLRCTVHGHLGYPDGTVFDGVRRRGKFE
jgi:type 1 glutamine amidotransferase